MCQHFDKNVMKCNLCSEARWNKLLKITEIVPGYSIITHVCLDPDEYPHCVMLEAHENELKNIDKKPNVETNSSVSLESAIKRGHMFLENGDWDSAYTCFGRALDIVRLRT